MPSSPDATDEGWGQREACGYGEEEVEDENETGDSSGAGGMTKSEEKKNWKENTYLGKGRKMKRVSKRSTGGGCPANKELRS